MESSKLAIIKQEKQERMRRLHENSLYKIDMSLMQNDFRRNKMTSIDNTVSFFRTRFSGIDIPKEIIVKTCHKVFDRCSTQEQLNRECTQYLLKNLANM